MCQISLVLNAFICITTYDTCPFIKMSLILPETYFLILQSFAEVTSTYPRGMMDMLENLRIPHQGRHHSGIGRKLMLIV